MRSHFSRDRSCKDGAVDHPDLFEVASPDFADNGMLSEDNASTGTSLRGPWACGGKNISPALSWSRAPADTRSFAIIMDDPDAASGRGGNHWITYDIPADVTSVARGDADKPGKFVSGDSGRSKLAPRPASWRATSGHPTARSLRPPSDPP